MIKREQILQLIEGYGADLQRWPVSNQQQLSEHIAADSELSVALSMTATDELILNECFASSEPQWSLAAETNLAEKITASVANSQTPAKITPWWQSVIQRFIDPSQVLQAFPSVVAMLLLLIVVQVIYTEEPRQIDAVYSAEELQDWFVFEGGYAELEQRIELGQKEGESTASELTGFVEDIYYL